MKKSATLLMAGIMALSITSIAANVSFAPANAEAPKAVNLFETEANWKHNKEGSNNPDSVAFDDGVLKVRPRYLVGSTYCERAMGQGKISFTYQITPDEYDGYFDMTTEAGVDEWIDTVMANQPFFGVLFYNSPVGVKPSGALTIPFNEGAGGFPYMVAFDAEKQNTSGKEEDKIRNSQLGLTLRRYKYEGSHDFTRWSSVDPTNATYVNSSGKEYESKIPAFYKPVTLRDCFDGEEHSVDIEVKNLYKEKGDEQDAVKIDVTFDGEICLTVIDEMPFEGDGFNEFEDKRTRDGYISFLAHGGTQDQTDQYYEYLISVKSFTVEFGESNGSDPANEKPKGGCGSVVMTSGIAAIAGVCALSGVAVAMIARKKKNENK